MKKPCKSSNSRMSGAVGSGNSSSDGSIERSDHSSTGSLSRSYEASDLGATPSDSAAAYGSASSVTMTPLVCKKSIRGREGSHSSRTSSSGESGAGVSDLERRIVSLFQKQSEKEVTDSEESRELNKRVDPELLTEVQAYEAVPSEAASYSKAAFWDERYSSEEEGRSNNPDMEARPALMRKWVIEYHPWVTLAPTLTRYIDQKDEILVCGCGNSEMSVDMFDDGRSFDLTRKEFPEKRFDVALDKACLDSIVCGFNGAWMADLYLQQMDRILQPDGAFICISHVGPEERLELLEYWDLDTPEKCFAWDVYVDLIRKPGSTKGQNRRLGDDSFYYIYVCIKDPTKTEQKMKKERLKLQQERLKVLASKRGRGWRNGRRRGRR